MANIRNGVPAGWQWRDGRPRWVPSPTLRKLGWKGRDLKDGRGAWLDEAASIANAKALTLAVAAWRAGDPVPIAFAATAPAGACDELAARGHKGAAALIDPFGIGALIDAYLASPELIYRKDGQPRPRSTVDDYRRKLKRLVDALAGYARLPEDAKEHAAHAAATAKVRAASVFILQPAEGPDGLVDPLHKAYWKLHSHAGVHMAFGVLACASAWLAWARRRKSRRIHNWAEEVNRETPPGRIRPLTWPEIAALVQAAEALAAKAESPEEALAALAVADAIVLGVDLSWSEADLLALTWPQIAKEQGRRVAMGARQKTGRVGGTPFLSMGVRRLAQILGRQRRLAAQPLKVIHLPRRRVHKARRAASDADYFRHLFALVRTQAALTCPSAATATFADTRDTGFSLGRQAGLTDDGTASRTRQSRANIKQLADRNYGEIGPVIAHQAAGQLDAYVEGQLKKHGVKL